MTEMFDDFKNLCGLSGVSGNEKGVSDYIISKLNKIDGVQYKRDRLGNILVHKKGEAQPKTKLLLSAHMDEVGLIITSVGDTGMLKFTSVGGIDPRVVLGRRVNINGRVGVIGTKAVHLQKSDERKTAPDFESLLIDIGAESKDDALKYVKPGDTASFESDFVEFGDGCIKAKAIDDRIGCSIILEILKKPLRYDVDCSFVVQEEVGLRGARAAAYSTAPDAAIVIEATTAADIANVPEDKKVCYVGKGPVISFMDGRTVYDRELYNLAFDTAVQSGIPCQAKLAVAGGNDAGAIHLSREGVKPLAVSLPCRYLHSPSCVIKYEDAENTLRLVRELCTRICEKALC
ncbi:MAG TPA: M42 family peptidase [Ruminiclostridium sp.]|nr:M42 family peptidase [Ruminiclostridium sp.]